jgi:hypothetical protein
LYIAPLSCHIIPPLSDTFYRTNLCNRLREHYKDNIKVRWEVIDPKTDEDLKDAPSIWNFKKDKFGR